MPAQNPSALVLLVLSSIEGLVLGEAEGSRGFPSQSFSHDIINITSGKLMLELIDKYKNKGEAFGFETTLSGKKWVKMMRELREAGYMVFIYFLDLASVELAVSRVRYRVESGGHNIPEETIRRRYLRSRSNFWYNYKDMAHDWYLFDNSSKTPELIANNIQNDLKVINQKYFDFFKKSIGKIKKW